MIFAMNMEEVVKDVLEKSPVIQEKIKYFRSVKQDVNMAETGYYPKLDLVASYGREKTENSTYSYPSISLTMHEVSLILTQNIFEGFGTQYDIQKQIARLKSAAYGVVEQADKTALDMIETYIDLLKQKELLELSNTNVQTKQNIHNKLQERIDSGVGINSEIQQSTSRLALSQSNYVSQLNNYEDAITNFKKIYGAIVDPEKLDIPQNVLGLPKSFQGAFEEAKLKHPSLHVQRANIEVVKNNYELTKTNNYPTIDFEIRQDWTENTSGIEGDDDSTSALIKVNWNLYNGGSDSYNKQKSISEWHKELESYNDLVRSVEERLSLAWNASEFIKKQIGYLELHEQMSKMTLDSYLAEFDLGRRSLLDILDTEEELYSAKRELVNSKYDALLAQYRILEAMGILSTYIDSGFQSIVGFGNDTNSKVDTLDTLPSL
jgi:adhesin transport system outer membrane protein